MEQPTNYKFGQISIEEVYQRLNTNADGLSSREVKHRIQLNGQNVIEKKKQMPLAYKFLIHLGDLFSILLMVAGVLAFIGEMPELGAIVFIIVLLNTFFTLFQEWRAQKAMEALKNWVPEYTKVHRNNSIQKILAKDLVPGDIIHIEEGDRVPADARIIEAYDLWTNNVALTGESEPQERKNEIRAPEPLVVEIPEIEDDIISSRENDKEDDHSGDTKKRNQDGTNKSNRKQKHKEIQDIDYPCLLYMGTTVVKGQGTAVVYATGMQTQFGQIAELTQSVEDNPSPLQKEIADMGKRDFIIAMSVGLFFFIMTYYVMKQDLYSCIIFFIGVMIACVPEGLQVTVSSVLAINVLKMADQNVLVKKLSAVQSLGSVTVICTDKTGTITKGEMTVKKIWTRNRIYDFTGVGYTPKGDLMLNGHKIELRHQTNLAQLLEITSLCNSAKLEQNKLQANNYDIIGDPTEGALLIAAMKAGINPTKRTKQKPTLRIIPFDSDRKKMTIIHQWEKKYVVYTKGAPRDVWNLCNRRVWEDKVQPISKKDLIMIENKVQEFGKEGLRILAVAYREFELNQINLEKTPPNEIEKNLIFVGLVAMRDPPRPEVKEAVQSVHRAGIKIALITGDYGPTAQAIAEEVSIVDPNNARIIRGPDLENMPDEVIVKEVRKRDIVFARVRPDQKLRIVKALKKSGEIVAVTGDGTNDAPSLKEANIGVAMGVCGTDIAKESAEIVLLDDSFASIVKAIESGRAIYDNIRRFIGFVFAHNWAELIPYLIYVLLGIPLPLLVVQVLAIDLVIDIFPSLALSQEPPDPEIMQSFPRSIKEPLFNRSTMFRSLFIAIVMSIGTMAGCFYVWHAGGWELGESLLSTDPVYMKGTTMVFGGIVIGQLGNAFTSRSNKVSLFKMRDRSNKWMKYSAFIQVGLLSFFIYIPIFQNFFGTVGLSFVEWIYLFLIAGIVIFADEIRKAIIRLYDRQSPLFKRRFEKKDNRNLPISYLPPAK